MKLEEVKKELALECTKIVLERGADVGLADKIYREYKTVIDNLINSISKKFNLHPSVISLVVAKLINKYHKTQHRPWTETIKKVDDKYVVYPKSGGKRLGTHDSKKKAQAQLAAIEISKNK